MPRTATEKWKPKTEVERYNSASSWLRWLIWLHYLGHLTKDGEKQGLSCKEKEEKYDPTIGGIEQYKASGNIKTYRKLFTLKKIKTISLSLSLSLSLVISRVCGCALFLSLSLSLSCVL